MFSNWLIVFRGNQGLINLFVTIDYFKMLKHKEKTTIISKQRRLLTEDSFYYTTTVAQLTRDKLEKLGWKDLPHAAFRLSQSDCCLFGLLKEILDGKRFANSNKIIFRRALLMIHLMNSTLNAPAIISPLICIPVTVVSLFHSS